MPEIFKPTTGIAHFPKSEIDPKMARTTGRRNGRCLLPLLFLWLSHLTHLQPGKPAPTEWVRAGLALARDYCGLSSSGSSACSMLIHAHWQPSDANATAVCSAISRLQNGPAILISPPNID